MERKREREGWTWTRLTMRCVIWSMNQDWNEVRDRTLPQKRYTFTLKIAIRFPTFIFLSFFLFSKSHRRHLVSSELKEKREWKELFLLITSFLLFPSFIPFPWSSSHEDWSSKPSIEKWTRGINQVVHFMLRCRSLCVCVKRDFHLDLSPFLSLTPPSQFQLSNTYSECV